MFKKQIEKINKLMAQRPDQLPETVGIQQQFATTLLYWVGTELKQRLKAEPVDLHEIKRFIGEQYWPLVKGSCVSYLAAPSGQLNAVLINLACTIVIETEKEFSDKLRCVIGLLMPGDDFSNWGSDEKPISRSRSVSSLSELTKRFLERNHSTQDNEPLSYPLPLLGPIKVTAHFRNFSSVLFNPPQNLAHFLSKFTDDKCFDILLEVLDIRSQLPALMRGESTYCLERGQPAHCFTYFSSTQKRAIFRKYLDDLPKMIVSQANCLDAFASCVSHAIRCELLNKIKQKLPAVIETLPGCAQLFSYSYRRDYTEFLVKALERQLFTMASQAASGSEPRRAVGYFSTIMQQVKAEAGTWAIDIVYQAFEGTFTRIIQKAIDFRNGCQYLAGRHRQLVYKALQDKLPGFILTLNDFRNVLEYLEPFQRDEIFARVKNTLPQIAEKANAFVQQNNKFRPSMIVNDIRDVLQWLGAGDSRAIIYEAFRDTFKQVIGTARDFWLICEYLPPEQRLALYHAFEDKLPAWIKTISDLRDVLEYFEPLQRSVIFARVACNLPQMVSRAEIAAATDGGFLSPSMTSVIICEVRSRLDADQRAIVDEKFKHIFTIAIKTGEDFNQLYQYRRFDSGTRAYLFAVFKDELAQRTIKTMMDFAHVLTPLDVASRTELFTQIESQLPEIAERMDTWNEAVATCFRRVWHALVNEQRTALLNACQKQFLALIANIDAFILLHDCCLSEDSEPRALLFEWFQERFFDFITSALEFNRLLQLLTSNQRMIVIDKIQDKYPQVIKNHWDFTGAINGLSSSEVQQFCKWTWDMVVPLLNDARAFYLMIYALAPEHRTVIFSLSRELLPDIIRTVDNLAIVFKPLSFPECVAIALSIQDRLPSLITNADDLEAILKEKEPAERARLAQWLVKKLEPRLADYFHGKWKPMNEQSGSAPFIKQAVKQYFSPKKVIQRGVFFCCCRPPEESVPPDPETKGIQVLCPVPVRGGLS